VRTIKRVLNHPVTGEPMEATIRNKADWEVFERTRRAWAQIAQKRSLGQSDATAVEQPRVTPQGTGVTQMPARSQPRLNITDEQMLRSQAPSLIAMLASALVPGAAPYAPWLRIGAASLGGAAGAPIAGTDPGREALTQGVLGGTGELLRGPVSAIGKGLVAKGIGASPEVRRSFGNVAKVASRERIGVSNQPTLAEGPERAGLGEKLLGNFGQNTGSAEAARRMETIKQRLVPRLLTDKTTHNPVAVFNEVRTRIQRQLSKQTTGREAQLDAVDEVLKEARLDPMNQGSWDNLTAWERKQGAQNKAADLLDKRNRTAVSAGAADAKAEAEILVNAELQKVLNDRLNRIPGYRPLATRFRELEGVRRAMLDAETGGAPDPTASMRVVGGGGTQPRAALSPEGMLSPQFMTGLGRGLDHPVTSRLLQNVPRGVLEGMRLGDPTMEPLDFFQQQKAQRDLRGMNP